MANGWRRAGVALLAGVSLAPVLAAQEPARLVSLVGEATSVDAGAQRLTLKPDAGEPVVVVLSESTRLLRSQPGATNLSDASPVQLSQVAAGDRVMVRGSYTEDHSLQARQVVVMTRDDIARKQDDERADWRRRGVLGTVASVDPASGEIGLRRRRPGNETVTVRTAGRSVAYRRYAPDSVKFSDAATSSFGEVQVGDELRALGERDPDGAVLAEQIVFGSFRMVAGTVKTLSPQGLVLQEDDSRRQVTVSVGPDARVLRLPAELAARLAGRSSGAAPPSDPGHRPWAGPGSARSDDLADRLPAASLSELKPGDRVVVTSTQSSDATRANAIAVLMGVEPLFVQGGRGRGARGVDVGMPPELMDLGLGIP